MDVISQFSILNRSPTTLTQSKLVVHENLHLFSRHQDIWGVRKVQFPRTLVKSTKLYRFWRGGNKAKI